MRGNVVLLVILSHAWGREGEVRLSKGLCVNHRAHQRQPSYSENVSGAEYVLTPSELNYIFLGFY